MSLILSWGLSCDCCGVLIARRSATMEKEEHTVSMERNRVFGLDLCHACRILAKEAVDQALAPVLEAQKHRRSS